MKTRVTVRGLGLLLPALAILAGASGASAWSRYHDSGHGYTVLKAGGYELDSGVRQRNSLGGLFVGVEVGAQPSRFVELGMTADWLRRRQGRTAILFVDDSFELPVQGVVDLEGTATDLVPLGGIVRVRFPVADGKFVPFVSGQLSFDLLRLAYREIQVDGDPRSVEERSEYFQGLGRTLALGVEARLDESFGLLLEAGVHESEPSKSLDLDGIPVEGRVDAGGEFLRFGMRFGFP